MLYMIERLLNKPWSTDRWYFVSGVLKPKGLHVAILTTCQCIGWYNIFWYIVHRTSPIRSTK